MILNSNEVMLKVPKILESAFFLKHLVQRSIGVAHLCDVDITHIAAVGLQGAVGDAPGAPAGEAGIAEEADDGFAEAGGDVHRAAIAANHLIGRGQTGDQLFQCCGGIGALRQVSAA